MKRLIAAGATAALVVSPAAALAKTPTAGHVRAYTALYHRVAKQFGHRTPGRNIVRNGTPKGAATDAQVVKSIAVMRRMLAPPPKPVYVAQATTSYTATTTGYTTSYTPVTSYSGGGCGGDTPYSGGGQCWAIPYGIVQCESGGQNVPNSTGSGAMGYYQIEGGGGSGSKAQQDAAAHAMYQQRGTEPWSSSQGCWG